MANDQVAIDAVKQLFKVTAALQALLDVMQADLGGGYFVPGECEDIVQAARDAVE